MVVASRYWQRKRCEQNRDILVESLYIAALLSLNQMLIDRRAKLESKDEHFDLQDS